MKNVKNGYYINGKIYVNSYDEFMETIENESLGNDEFLYFMAYIEDTDDYIQMNEPADYYKDEYGICPCCKHKLSKEEMERKKCSKCLQKLSGKTGVFTRKGLIKCDLVVRIIIFLLIISFFVLEPIQVISGIAIIVLVILLVWGIIYGVSQIFDLDYKAHVKQRARYNQQADIFPYVYNCLGKKERMIVCKMMDLPYTLIVKYNSK